jgi:hypothetical protein
MLASTIVRSVAPVFFLFRRGKTGVGRPSRGMSVGSPRENTASTSWASIRLPFGHFFLKCVWIRGCRSYLFPIAGHGQAPRRWKAANRSNTIFHTLPSPVGSLSEYAKYKTFQGEEGGSFGCHKGLGYKRVDHSRTARSRHPSRTGAGIRREYAVPTTLWSQCGHDAELTTERQHYRTFYQNKSAVFSKRIMIPPPPSIIDTWYSGCKLKLAFPSIYPNPHVAQ